MWSSAAAVLLLLLLLQLLLLISKWRHAPCGCGQATKASAIQKHHIYDQLR